MISNHHHSQVVTLPWNMNHWPNKELLLDTRRDYRESAKMNLATDQKKSSLREFLNPLRINDSQLYDVARSFSNVFRDLASSNESNDQTFSPVPVTRLPNGRENGRYLAVDVGITTLKVAFIELLGENASRSRSISNVMRQMRHSRVRRTLEKAWRIEERLKQDQPHELFSWIGNCIAEVVADDLLSNNGAFSDDRPAYIETGIAFGLPIK